MLTSIFSFLKFRHDAAAQAPVPSELQRFELC